MTLGHLLEIEKKPPMTASDKFSEISYICPDQFRIYYVFGLVQTGFRLAQRQAEANQMFLDITRIIQFILDDYDQF